MLTFRTVTARALTISAAIITIFTLGYTLVDGGATELWRASPFVLFGLALIWMIFGHPRVIINDQGVVLINTFRSIHLPWASLRAVETRWGLTLETESGRYTSWAIPAASRLGTRFNEGERPDKSGQAGAEHGIRRNTAEGVALAIANHRDGQRSGQPEEATLVSTWNFREITLLIAGVGLLVGSAMWS